MTVVGIKDADGVAVIESGSVVAIRADDRLDPSGRDSSMSLHDMDSNTEEILFDSLS